MSRNYMVELFPWYQRSKFSQVEKSFVASHLPLDLAGRIHLHELVALQSIDKTLGGASQKYVWMGGLHALCWMVGYVIKNHQKLLQQSDNKLVCIVIPRGNPRLEQFYQFTAPSLYYTDYVNQVRSPTIVKVYAKDTVEFPANAIQDFLAYAPRHPTSVVPLRTKEQKREQKLVYDQFFMKQKREQVPIYDRSEILSRLVRVETVVLKSLS